MHKSYKNLGPHKVSNISANFYSNLFSGLLEKIKMESNVHRWCEMQSDDNTSYWLLVKMSK
jgi:hypothetical protein